LSFKSLVKDENLLNRNSEQSRPFYRKKIKGRSCPWLNENVKREMNERDKLLRMARKLNKDTDWNAYKRKRNFVKNELQRAKRSFYKTELKENSDKPSKFWDTIKKIFPTKSKSPNLPKFFK